MNRPWRSQARAPKPEPRGSKPAARGPQPDTRRSLRARDRLLRLSLAVVVSIAAYALPAAQTAPKKALSVEDYPKWRSITDSAISADGNWATYVLQLTNVPTTETKPVLHVLNLETNADVAVANATSGMFSADSQWIAYHVDPAPGRRGRGGPGSGAADAPNAPPVDTAVPPGAPGPPTPAPPPGTPPPPPGATPPIPPAPTTPATPPQR